MTPLDKLIDAAISAKGAPEAASRVYEALFNTTLFIPSKKPNGQEKAKSNNHYIPLYTEHQNQFYLLAFDTFERFDHWAGSERETIDHFEIIGSQFIRALGNQVTVCLNFGTDHYKEFPPDEIAQLKSILD